ncbi:MAG: SMP-30/gluconolactonase/LRE family protein [Bacteroidota bacterium]
MNLKIQEIWSKKISDFTPESVLYDDQGDVLYVSHFDRQTYKKSNPEGFISKMNTKGDMLDSLWIGGLNAPTGICKSGDKLFVVDRKELVEVSLKKAEVLKKYPFPDGTAFPNDITVDKKGNVYISNSDPSVDAVDIFTLEKGKIVSWMVSDVLANTNGIFSDDEHVFIGSARGSKLYSINLETKETSEITSFGSGIIDGVQTLDNGGVIISQWKGLIYYLSPEGDITLLLDKRGEFNTAAFEYSEEIGTLFVPTFLGKGLKAFKINWTE